MKHILRVFTAGVLLTFDHILNICGVLQDLGQAVEQHGGLAVAVGDIFGLLEHLIQSCRLDLKRTENHSRLLPRGQTRLKSRIGSPSLSLKAFRLFPWLVFPSLTISTAWL